MHAYNYNLLGYFSIETTFHPECDINSESAIKIFPALLIRLIKGYHLLADRCCITSNLIQNLDSDVFVTQGHFKQADEDFPVKEKKRASSWISGTG